MAAGYNYFQRWWRRHKGDDDLEFDLFHDSYDLTVMCNHEGGTCYLRQQIMALLHMCFAVHNAGTSSGGREQKGQMASDEIGGGGTVCHRFIWTAAWIPNDAPAKIQRRINRLNIEPVRKPGQQEFNWEHRHANPLRHQRRLQLLQTSDDLLCFFSTTVALNFVGRDQSDPC